MSTWVRRVSPFVVCIGLFGCSSSSPVNTSAEPTGGDALQEVANMIRDYASTNNRPPAKAADFATYENLYSIGYKAIKSGSVVVIWGAQVAGEGGSGGDAIIAYEKSAPDTGGAVLLENGQVKQMSAAEFAAAPKAKGKT